MKNNKTEPSCLLVVIKTFSCDTDNIYSAVQTLLIVWGTNFNANMVN